MGHRVTGRAAVARFFLRGDRLHPAWRTAAYLVVVLGTSLLLDLLLSLAYAAVLLLVARLPLEAVVTRLSGQMPPLLMLATGLSRLTVALGFALLFGRLLDREPAATMGLAGQRAGRDGALGFALGLGAMLLIAGVTLVCGWSAWERGTGGAATFLLYALAMLPLAAAEEVTFRGYVLRAVGGWRGPWAAVLSSSFLFALVHTLNPNFNLLAMFNIFLAGVLFAVVVERTGTLWMAVGYHFAWNLAQGPLLGFPVSGTDWAGLLALGTSGPPLLTGGAFGPEGGLLATAALALSLFALWLPTRRPATAAVAVENQRAALEARYGPLPHRHHRLAADPRLLDATARAAQSGRMGEVVLFLRRPDGQLLLHTKRFYPPGVYRLPSGGIRQGEDVLAAAAREAEEETGLVVGRPEPLGLLTYTLCYGRSRFFFHSWLVRGDVAGEPAVNDSDERISGFRWVEPEALGQVAADLRALPSEWAAWGHFRALAHEVAVPLRAVRGAERRMQGNPSAD